jgi:hypothetical protein
MTTPPLAHKPDLKGVFARIERSKMHVADFEARTKPLLAECRAAVMTDYDDERSEYVVRIGRIPAIPPVLSVIIGDAIHNLRVSLDYLMWQLVIGCGATPNDKTMFPILMTSPTPNRHGQVRVNVNPGIPMAMQQALDDIQPYKRVHPRNHELAVLHNLDIVDKHRQILLMLIDVNKLGWFGDVDLLTINPGPYEDGSEICRFAFSKDAYPPPQAKGPMPLTVAPMFDLCLRESDAGAWDRAVSASDLMRILLKYVEHDVLSRFKAFL